MSTTTAEAKAAGPDAPRRGKKVTLVLPAEEPGASSLSRDAMRRRKAASAPAGQGATEEPSGGAGAGSGAGAGGSKAPQTAPLKFVDKALLQMGRTDKRLDNVIHGMMYLDRGFTRDELVDIVKERWLPAHMRTRSAVVKDASGKFMYQEQSSFDWDYHVREVTLPEPADRDALFTYIGQLFEERMDTEKPLWQFFTVPRLTGIPGVTAGIITRAHHVLGDGTSLVHLFLSHLVDSPSVTATPRTRSSGKKPKVGRDTGALAPVRSATRQFRVACHGVLQGLVKPALPRDTDTIWKAKSTLACGGKRNITTTPHLSLDAIKEIKNAVGGTVNDVLVTVLCGATRRYLLAHGDEVVNSSSTTFRTCFPFNTRPRGADIDETLGNDFVLLSLALPLHIQDPVDRLHEVKRLCEDMKRSPETPIVAFLNKLALNTMPAAMYTQTTQKLFEKFSFLMTNVIGPPAQAHIGGRTVVDLAFWVPTPVGSLASILTYNNRVTLGVAAVPELMPDSNGRLVDYFEAELNELHALTKAGKVGPRVGCGRREMADFGFCVVVLPLLIAAMAFSVMVTLRMMF